jgi:hypothetical protein
MTSNLFRAMAVAVGIGAAWAAWAGAEYQAPAEGAALPAITLPAPKEAAHQTYLGIAGQKQFAVADIPAEVVIIQVFNMY